MRIGGETIGVRTLVTARSRRSLLAGLIAAIVAVVAAATVPAAADGAAIRPIGTSAFALEIEPFVRIPATTLAAPRLNAVSTTGDRMFVVEERDGLVYEIFGERGRGRAVLFADIGGAIEASTARSLEVSNLFHGGLRGIAFHPDFARNGLFYSSHMETRPDQPVATDYLSDAASPVAADSVVAEWRVDPQTGGFDPSSYRAVLRVGLPVYDHPIKQLAFNPFAEPGESDYGMLYVAHGDGSVLSATAGGGQNNDALGKILRVDPRRSAIHPYSIPADNPFVDDPTMHDAVWSLGHRNPHHLAFGRDRRGMTILVAAEPGRDNVEEVNLIVRGGDYGWSEREGTFVHRSEGGGRLDGIAPLPADDWRNGYVYPAAQFAHVGERGRGFRRSGDCWRLRGRQRF